MSQTRQNDTPVIAGLTSLASFMAVTNMMIAGTWESGMYWLGARGLLSSIIIGIISTELFCWLSKGERMAIKMPDGVPPAVSRAFAKLFPVILTMATCALLNLLIWMPFFFTDTKLVESRGTQYTFKTLVDITSTKDLNTLGALGVSDVDGQLMNFSELTNIKSGTEMMVVDPNGDALGETLKLADGKSPLLSFSTTSVDKYITGGDVNFTSALYAGVIAPFLGLADNMAFALGLAILYVLLVSFFWFFGLHGSNIVNGAFNPIWLILYAENVSGADHVFVQGTFDAYILIGGWAATLPLVISTLVFGKRDTPQYKVSRFALAPGIFQINEPVTFGYPLVLNALLIVPLFLVMPTLVITTYAGIKWFGVPPVRTLIPWTSPVGIGGLIASGSVWGFVLAIVNLFIAAAIWTPFVFIMNRANSNKTKEKIIVSK